jgi:hypothetical protein
MSSGPMTNGIFRSRLTLTFPLVPDDLEGAVLFGRISHLPVACGIRDSKAHFPDVPLVVDVLQECGCQSTLMTVDDQERHWAAGNSWENLQRIKRLQNVN